MQCASQFLARRPVIYHLTFERSLASLDLLSLKSALGILCELLPCVGPRFVFLREHIDSSGCGNESFDVHVRLPG